MATCATTLLGGTVSVMSFDLYFVTLKTGAGAAAAEAVGASYDDDDDGDLYDRLGPYLLPGLAPDAARLQVLGEARKILKTSLFATFQSTPLASLPLNERIDRACSMLFEYHGEHPAVVPLSLSRSGNLKELVRFAAVLLNALPGSVFLYDPQTNQLLDHDAVLEWSDV